MNESQFHRFSHPAMNTHFEVVINHPEREYSRQAAAAVFREVDRLENLLSRFNATSDIGQINLLKPGQSVQVSPETMECLLSAMWVWSETGGAFDVTVGPLMNAFREGRPIADQLAWVGMRKLVLDPAKFTVGVTTGGVVVDLGAIGKGFALDKAAEVLEEWEITNALLHGGTSSALALGVGDRTDGWGVGVGGDWQPQIITLCDLALGGSGTEVQGAHILDPRMGQSAGGHLAAWAVSPSAAIADGLSTAFMVMSPDEVKQFCAAHEENSAYVVNQAGEMIHP